MKRLTTGDGWSDFGWDDVEAGDVPETDDEMYALIDDRITVRLIGTDGNAFALIGKVAQALRRAGRPDDAAAFVREATSAGSYDEVLRIIMRWVEVE